MRMGLRAVRFENWGAVGRTRLADAIDAIVDRAEPVDPIEVSLADAVGLVLAEPVVADVDLPPFDRVATPGFALRSADSAVGALLRVARPFGDEAPEVDSGEAVPVGPTDPLPLGADAVLDPVAARPDPPDGPPHVIEVRRGVAPGDGVVRRGATLVAGSVLAERGERIGPALLPLLAGQGQVAPLCHRRVRVAILAVGDHLVGPGDAPILHRERNAAGLAVGSLVTMRGGMIHDLGAICSADFSAALDRALRSHVVVVLGTIDGPIRDALEDARVESTFLGLAFGPGGSGIGHGLGPHSVDGSSPHLVCLPIDPASAFLAATLIVLPLLARLQGADPALSVPLRVVWDAAQPATSGDSKAIPASLIAGADGRLRARPVVSAGPVDLPDLARADGVAVFPAGSGPWHGGEVIEFTPFAPWSGRIEV